MDSRRSARRALLLSPLMVAAAAAFSKEKSAMNDDTRGAGKSPTPSDATPALKQHVTDLRLNLAAVSDALSGTPDLDVVNALAVQERGLGSLAAIALRHARDPDLLALAQRIADQTSGTEVALKPLRARLQR